MGVKKDLEYYVFRFTDGIQGNINSAISALNTEKAGTDVDDLGLAEPIVLDTIADGAFFWNMNTDRLPDEQGCYMAFRWSVQPEANNGYDSSDKIRVVAAIIVPNQWSTDSSELTRRLMRYRKALTETMKAQARAASLHGFELIQVPDDLLFSDEGDYWAVTMIAGFSYA